jgi:hypothetical protein
MMEQDNRDKQSQTQQQDDRTNRSDGKGTPVYLTGNSTLQSPEEHAHDQSVDPTKDTTISVSNDDMHEIKAGKLTGRDGTNTDQP